MVTANITHNATTEIRDHVLVGPSIRDVNTVAYVEILGVAEALQTIAEEWRALEQSLDCASVFQGCSWAAIAQSWAVAQDLGHPTSDYHVVITRGRDNRLTGLWPIQGESVFGATFVVGLGEPFCQYSDILIAPGSNPAVIIDAMLDVLRSLGRFSGVILRKVRDDAMCLPRLRYLSRAMSSAAAPAVDLRSFDGFQSYHGTIKTKTRKNLRNARNRLVRSGGDLQHFVHVEPQTVAAVAQRAFELRTVWLAQEGLSSRAFLDVGFESFIQSLCTHAAQSHDLSLVAFELRLGTEMLSLQWGFIDRGRYYAFMAVRNPKFDAQSPGRLHLEDVIRSCAEMGVEVIDFLAPDVDYKRTWATEIVPVRDYGIAFTLKGRLVLSGVLGAPRRLARKTFDAMPANLRQAAIRLLARKSD